MKPWPLLACLGALGLWAALASVILAMPGPAIELAGAVRANLAASGVTHPVTAVLLNFRGYDTLLEVAVLMVALTGTIAAGGSAAPAPAPALARTPHLLQLMARGVAPLMVTAAGYLLWRGSSAPGGAFQAGAVLASALVLLNVAGLIAPWRAPRLSLRCGLLGGLLVFLAVAALPSPQGALLHYPPALAGPLIVLVESALTLSLGLTLAGLFLWLPRQRGGA